MTTPIEEAEQVIAEIDAIMADRSLNAARRAGSLLPLLPKLLQACRNLRDYQLGYSLGNRRGSALVSKLLRTMLDSSTGELKWARELPQGTIPSEFRRALTDLLTHFKVTPP